jgi:hypothetical protein
MATPKKKSAPCGNVSTVGNAPSPNAPEPVVELRGVKYAEFASDETACYRATLYVDGAKFCEVSNDGHGGCDDYFPVKGGVKPSELHDALWDLAKRINPQAVRTWAELPGRDPKTGALVEAGDFDAMTEKYQGEYWKDGPQTQDSILEGVCGRLLTDHLIAKDLTRGFKTRVIFTLPDGRLMECKLRGNPVAAVVASVKLRNPGAVVLNEKPLAEAVAIMRAREPL